MNVWLYYIKLKGLTPALYAYTNNKQYHKKFEKERNSEIFIVKEKEVSKQEFYNFSAKHTNLNLKSCLFETYTEDEDEYKRNIVELVCTYNEESSVILNFEYINKEVAKSTNEVSMSFNKELMSALDKLYYYDFLKQKMNAEDYTNMLEYNKTYLDGINDMSDTPFGYNYDYLAIFVKMYGYTLKV